MNDTGALRSYRWSLALVIVVVIIYFFISLKEKLICFDEWCLIGLLIYLLLLIPLIIISIALRISKVVRSSNISVKWWDYYAVVGVYVLGPNIPFPLSLSLILTVTMLIPILLLVFTFRSPVKSES